MAGESESVRETVEAVYHLKSRRVLATEEIARAFLIAAPTLA
jgi:predicted RNA polymerase sigma factor